MKLITDDKRDITNEEWRFIPGFKKYKVTADGDVMNAERGTLKKETGSDATGWHYNLYNDEGRKTSRNYRVLVALAFPELFEDKPKPKAAEPEFVTRPYLKKSGWADIPGFPKHQAHIDGAVRTKKQRHALKTKINSLNGEEYVFIQSGEGLWPVSIADLVAMTFPEQELKEAA